MNQTCKFLLFLFLCMPGQPGSAQRGTSNGPATAFGDTLLKHEKYEEAFVFFSSNAATASKGTKGSFLFKAGQALYNNRKYEEALPFFELAQQQAESLGDDKLLALALINRGGCYTSLGRLAEGTHQYKQALPPLTRMNDDMLLGVVNFNLAHNYKERAQYDLAIQYVKPAIESFEKIEDQKNLAKAYETLGNIYRETDKDSLSISYHQRSLKINTHLNDKKGVSSNLNGLGNTYKKLYDYDRALDFYRQSLAIGDSIHQTTTLGNMAGVYSLLGNYKKAEEYFQKALQLRQQDKDSKAIANLLTDLGKQYLLMNNIPKAQNILTDAMDLAIEGSFKDVMLRNLQVQQELFMSLDDFKSAYDVQSKVMDLKKDIFNADGQKVIEQLTIDFEVKDLEKQNALLAEEAKLQKALAEKEKANRKVLFLALILAVLVIAFIASIYWQSRKQTKWQIAKRQEIQHRTKNFLQTLINLFRFQAGSINHPGARAIVKHAQIRLDAMMMIHRSLTIEGDNLNFTEYARQLVNLIKTSYENEAGHLVINWEADEVVLNADQVTPLALLLNELVSNVFKHGLEGNPSPELFISIKARGDLLVIIVKDNGPGFDISALAHSDSKGLSLIRIFAKQLGGKFDINGSNGTEARLEVKMGRQLN